MDQAGAVLGGDEVRREDAVRALVAQVVGERRRERSPDEVAALEPLDHPGRRVLLVCTEQVLGVGRESCRTDEVALGRAGDIRLDDDVVDVGADHDPEVRRERPRRRRPDQRQLAGLQAQADGDGGVLAVLVDVVVHAQLVVGQRRLVVPAVGQHAEALVDQALVVQLLEGPDDRLHVVGLERLVVVVEVDPPSLAGDVLTPVVGVLQDRGAAGGIELLDAELDDLVLGLDAELAHRLELGRQPVGVPAEPALDPAATHGLVARDQVLDVPGQQVAVVRQAVGEGRAVVEDELVVTVLPCRAVLHRGDEGAVLVPVPKDALLDLGEPRRGGHPLRRAVRGVVGGCAGDLGVGHGVGGPVHRSCVSHEDDIAGLSRRYRGTTSLAVPRVVTTRHTTALVPGDDEPIRPGLVGTIAPGCSGPVLPEARR